MSTTTETEGPLPGPKGTRYITIEKTTENGKVVRIKKTTRFVKKAQKQYNPDKTKTVFLNSTSKWVPAK